MFNYPKTPPTNSVYYLHDEEFPPEFSISFSKNTNTRLLPDAIRNICQDSAFIRPFLLYYNKEKNYAVVKIGISEKAIRITDTTKCIVEYFTPGKGAGDIMITISDNDIRETLFTFDGFSDQKLEYFIRIQNKFKEILKISIFTRNNGSDS